MSNKSLKIILASILIFIIVALTGVLVYSLTGHSFGFRFNQKTTLLASEEYDYNLIKNINIYAKEADVKFVVKDVDKISVKLYGNEKQDVSVDFDKDTLSVHHDTAFLCFGFCAFNSSVLVELPKKYQEYVNIDTVSGDINMESFDSTRMELKTVSGDIKIEDYNEVKAVTTSGEIHMGTVKIADAKTVSGEINILQVTDSFYIKTTSGDINIVNASLMNDSEIKTISGEVEIENLNDVYVDTKTVSGDIEVMNNNRLANVVLRIETTSGDVEVN